MNSPAQNCCLTTRLILVCVCFCLATLLVAFDLATPAQAAVPPLLQTLSPRFVNAQSAPLANAQLRLLCYIANSSGYTQTHDLRDTTTAQGQLAHQLPSDCSHVTAMEEIHQQPSGKPGRATAYTVYNTSWPTGNALPVSASTDIVIHSDQHLVLFDVAIALEWEPAAGSSYLTELEQGLRSASSYLFDVTDGQMAFGTWRITTGGQGWESADIRIRAANDYRPSAQVGGMVAAATTYTLANGASTIYMPGAIVLGRYWDGANAADPIGGAWSQPAAYRTLVHEWLHYALFLYDEYQAIDGDGRGESYCSCAELPQVGQNPAVCGQISADLAASVMGYHYTASELWLDGTEASCRSSEQFHAHGASDWETLVRWGAIQGIQGSWLRKPTGVIAGPPLGSLATLTGQPPVAASNRRIYLPWLVNHAATTAMQQVPAIVADSTAIQTSSAITLQVTLDAALPITDLLTIQVQIYTWEPATATQPARVLYQGTTTGPRQAPNLLGQAVLVGIKPGTEVAVYLTHPGAAQATRYVYHGPLDPALSQQRIQALVDSTSLSLAVIPVFDGARISAFDLTLQSSVPLVTPPLAQLCTPAAEVGCLQNSAWRQNMVDSSDAVSWTATLAALPNQPFPDLGVLQINTPSGPLLRWYETLGGVGPVRIRSHAPRRDGLITVDGAVGFDAEESLVFMMPTANQAALQAALPPGVGRTSGSPFEVKVLVSGASSAQVMAASGQQIITTTPAAPVLISMFYDNPADRPNLKPNQSQLLQYQPATGQWQIIASSGQSAALSWVASQPLSETGILAVGQMTSPDFGRKPEMFAKTVKSARSTTVQVQVVLPAATGLLTQTAAVVRVGVPTPIDQVARITCNIGACHYDAEVRQMIWQGEVEKADLLLFSFELALDPQVPLGQLPQALTLQATAFDGAVQHLLTAVVTLRGSPTKETWPNLNSPERMSHAESSSCCITNSFE